MKALPIIQGIQIPHSMKLNHPAMPLMKFYGNRFVAEKSTSASVCSLVFQITVKSKEVNLSKDIDPKSIKSQKFSGCRNNQ